jgi:hypothetical protein
MQSMADLNNLFKEKPIHYPFLRFSSICQGISVPVCFQNTDYQSFSASFGLFP